MKKFKQTLALVFAIALGYGAGQQGGRLWATTYPSSAGGGAPTDADYWVGTANGDLSAELVAQFAGADLTTASGDSTVHIVSSVRTFGVAYSANPTVFLGITEATGLLGVWGGDITTTTATVGAITYGSGSAARESAYLAIGN